MSQVSSGNENGEMETSLTGYAQRFNSTCQTPCKYWDLGNAFQFFMTWFAFF
jgi:hypothetical protein